MRVLQYFWFHFITVATSWLPDLRPVLRLRGFLLRPSASRGPVSVRSPEPRHIAAGTSGTALPRPGC